MANELTLNTVLPPVSLPHIILVLALLHGENVTIICANEKDAEKLYQSTLELIPSIAQMPVVRKSITKHIKKKHANVETKFDSPKLQKKQRRKKRKR